MNPREQIQADLKAAMKAKDVEKRDTLRLLTAAFKQAEVDQQKELTEGDILSILNKEAKRRLESITELEENGRDAGQEKMELELIQSYLPQQMERDEVEKLAKEAIEEAGATSAKEMGDVMKLLMPKVQGRADGKLVSTVVRELLS